MKIWLRVNFSSNIFRLIQNSFHVGLVYSLFHPTLHFYGVISKWAWTATKKILTIYLHYKNKMGKNTKIQQKKLKIAEREKASRPKKVYKGNRKKERLGKIIHSRLIPRHGFPSSESTSSNSITGKSMPVAILGLTLNERMNGLAYWMKHVGWHVQTI